MSRGRVIFVNRFYWPDEPATAQLLTDLAQALAARQYRVMVITSAPRNLGVPRTETKDNVLIRRIWKTRFGSHSTMGRLFNFIGFNLAAFFHLTLSATQNDVVIAMTDPPMLGVAGWLAARLRGAQVIHWVQDIYPEVAIDVTGFSWMLLLRPLRNLTWRRSSACVVPGEQMAAELRATGVPASNVFVSANWAPSGLSRARDEDVTALRDRWNLGGKFVAMYSGNLGRVHGIESLLEIATLLRNDLEIAFVFVGNGARKDSLEKSARARGLTNVFFFPAQPRSALAVSLSVGDIHFVTLQPGAERWVYPSKLYGITKVGRPVFFVGAPEAEIGRRIRKAGIGEVFERYDIAGIANAVRRLQQDPSRCREYSRAALAFSPRGFEQATDTWCHLIGAELATETDPL